MTFVRIGRVIRTLRRDRGWRQIDLGRRAVCSQQAISLIECGRGDRLSARTLTRVASQLECEVDLAIRWRGGQIERLLDEGHAHLENAIAVELATCGWEVRVEVTYSIGRDRGSIDVFAFDATSGVVLVVEVKTDLLSAEATARKLDEKVRLAREIALDRFGWNAVNVARLLVLPESRTARRRIAAHAELFRRLYPTRGHEVHRWLRSPSGSMSGLLFLAPTKAVGTRRALTSRRRICRP